MTLARPDSWGGFWRDEPAATSGATLANLPPDVQKRLDAPWVELAAALPRNARVLDLATGGGIVLDLLQRKRRDLKLTGIDAASDLPQRPGLTLKGGVTTDRLPFADGSFDAVTSRFGIEYGRLEASAAEAARVCRAGGLLCLVVHHAESVVLRHNRARLAALLWAARGSGWMDKAAALARARMATALATPPAFRAAAADGAQRFPGQSAAAEFLTGLVQILDANGAGPGTADGLRRLTGLAEGEIGRLQALMGAACDPDRLERLMDTLAGGGVEMEQAVTIEERPGGAPFAWLVRGKRR